MCGILGQLNFNGNTVDEQMLIRARDVLAHRGPDDIGLFINGDKRVGLAHRRLSIIDLSSGGHQPMSTEDGRYTIVFNGEIYNYREIQKAKFRNKNFRSGSDTEILLELYIKEGPECLRNLRGMFAFAVWDEKEKRLFAARDRFGIKPFFYLSSNNEFIFASELKAIKHLKKDLSLSMKAVDAFLKTGSVPAPLTIYNETKALLPGHYLEIQNGHAVNKKYWDFSELLTQPLEYDGNAKKLVKDSLLYSIKTHLVSDVEVGAFISGGIDSTAIVSLMRQAGHEKIKTVSVAFPGNKLDESEYSRFAANRYKTEHYEYKFKEQELIDDIEKILSGMDSPTIDGINTYFVSKAAKESGLKVVMSGVGGDELFGGYPSFKNIPRINNFLKFKKAVPYVNDVLKLFANFTKNKIPAKGTELLLNSDEGNSGYKLYRGLFTEYELKELGWSYGFDHPFTSYISEDSLEKGYFAPLQYISFLESVFYMRNQLLRDSDIFSMMHSLELRVPFVDDILYKDVLPYLDDSYDKKVQKKMLVECTGDLPDEIVYRSKMGFTFPFAEWISSGKLKDIIINDLSSGKLDNIFDRKMVSEVLSKFKSGKIHWSRVWALSVLRKFIGK